MNNSSVLITLFDLTCLTLIIFSHDFILFHYFRVTLGHLDEFLSTSCITNLSFLGTQEDGAPDSEYFVFESNY